MLNADRKLLLITGDDFGMCHAINMGVARAMTEGVVTSTNLMTPCPWIAEAVRLAKEHNLPCGVHFTLTCEWDRLRWRPLTAGASLRNQYGFMPQTVMQIGESISDEEGTAELKEQINVLRLMGIKLTHADMHMVNSDDRRPAALRVSSIMKRVATAEGLPLPRERDPSARYVYIDGDAMISGKKPDAIWATLEKWSEPGIYHLFSHPGEASPELENLCSTSTGGSPWASDYRVADLAFLTDPTTKRRIEDMGFQLIGIQQLLAR